MPITFKRRGSLFDEDVDALVNAVNCKGAMGAGIALEFARRFEQMYHAYKQVCREGLLRPGLMHAFRDLDSISGRTVIVINFPTKDHWSNPSKAEYIRTGLVSLYQYLEQNSDIKSLALPALGCGYGGLSWGLVKDLIETHLGSLPHDIRVFEPQ